MQRAPREDRIFRVPYGDEQLEFMAQPWFDVDVVESGSMPPIPDLAAPVRAATQHPLTTPSRPLRALSNVSKREGRAGDASPTGDKATAVVVVTDLTRACPDDVLVPPILDQLNAGGSPDDRITVVVAVGLHRATTEDEKREKLGGVVDRVRVIDSEGRDAS